MSEAAFQLAYLRDRRLASLAVSALPAWLWSRDATRILWANPTGAAIFGASTSAAIATCKFDAGQPAAAQIAQMAETLPQNGAWQAQRLHGFGAGVGRALACACARIALADGTPAILVVATERAGPDLALGERVRRLLAGWREPVAAFTADGNLIYAVPTAHADLGNATSLAALGAEALANNALRGGHAEGQTGKESIAFDRVGPDPVVIATFTPPGSIEQPVPPIPIAAPPAPAEIPPEPAEGIAGRAPLAEGLAPMEEQRPSEEAPATVEECPPLIEAAEPARIATEPTPVVAELTPPAIANVPATPVEALPVTDQRHPLRFVWQMDHDGRFTLGSEEFAALAGPRTAAVLGQPWQDIATALGLDPEERVAQAIATRDTWSGITVSWPVDDSAEPLAVELSGLPVFDRERTFRGYRGFGVCRDIARLTALRERKRAASTTPTPAVTPATDAQRLAAVPANVVPFPAPAPDHTPTLSPIERRAFHELSRKLTQRLTASGIEYKVAAAVDPDAAGLGDELANPEPNAAGPSDTSDLAEVARTMSERGAAHDAGQWHPELEVATRVAQSGRDARPMFDKLPVGVLVYRLDQLLYANPAFLRWGGHDSLEGVVSAGGLDSLFVEPAIAVGGVGIPLALRVDRGDKIPVQAELVAIHWDGEPAHALVTVAAVGGPEPARTQLDEAQATVAELRAILDTATDGVIVLDRAGHILSANRSAEALFGYESRELAGKSFLDLFAPESTDTASEYFESLARDGIASMLNNGREVIGRARQGGLIPLFVTLGTIGDDRAKLCAVFRDMTQWKKTEGELLSAKRQAEQASSAKSDFLAKISHEIRTPLNAIIGFSEVMMEERFGPIGNERYRDYLKDIHASGGHLLSLINDLLDLSKIEAGKLDLTFASVALNDLTQQCVAIMQPQANRERIIIRTSLAPALPQVLADARSVRQIVLNLLSNSIKFTGAGGQVIVSTALNDNGEVVLRVRDTGIGMSEKDLATALEPFRQLATTAARGGTGLGLPLTKALAEANRAKFDIKSAPNSGTLVEIAFPAAHVLAG
jgi:PAS domain S-box-containing protein